MKQRLFVTIVAIVVFLGMGGRAVLACGCGCGWICGQNRCEFTCSDCSLSEEISASATCCSQARDNTPCGLE